MDKVRQGGGGLPRVDKKKNIYIYKFLKVDKGREGEG